MTGVEFRREQWTDAASAALRDLMDAEIQPRYADVIEPGNGPTVSAGDILGTIVAYVGDEPAGTASLKLTDGYAEVKRVFVAPSHRRRGLAARLLAEVEALAREAGYGDVVLETGERQPEAIALYEREGWSPIPPFGPYTNSRGIGRYFTKSLGPLPVDVELTAVDCSDAATTAAGEPAPPAEWSGPYPCTYRSKGCASNGVG
ncbi:GNAT family N-acetyltransferase [Microbacterium trichothecenolyticum]|uniref:GNAT family N-acetyltransferase n=1 Tax=Microbacterium trichothecenolyticum TaxID=69370 RepID=UPI001C6F0455|nr:GNAT family N-acetyltransferase [Microbacterium trichothecenolyticum]MBW9121908.1 GNAT family N-acetyltransferase [Microbacterium trichothecenolyticum]